VICSETAIVAPLETLNTNLNYKILDDFIDKFTDSTTKFSMTPSNNNMNSNTSLIDTRPILIPYGQLRCLFSICSYRIYTLFVSVLSSNRFSIESVEHNNSAYTIDKKSRIHFGKSPQYSINTITELPERTFDDER
jgi:hypothetical protein